MPHSSINILSIAPYRFLPLRNGGHQAIAKLHHYIGLLCNDNVVSTEHNDDNKRFSFKLHKIFPDKPLRYFPGYGLNKMFAIAEDIGCTHVICEHPYMAITAMVLANKLDVPWYIRSHNIESERFRAFGKAWWPILRKYEQYAMQKADGVFFITQEDAGWSQEHFKLPADKCHTIPFGTDMQAIPAGQQEARALLSKEADINTDIPLLYFLGALDYTPNEEAVVYILDEIQPRLVEKGIQCDILIAGKGLNKELQGRIADTEHIKYMGFVPDLEVLLKACDIMLNPVLKGGGIKTKAVEALGYNKAVVSTVSGAAGIMPEVCGQKLLLSEDNNWEAFVGDVVNAINNKNDIPAAFYETYYHGNIAQKVFSILESSAG